MKGLERIAADRRHLVARQVRVSSGFTWGRESVVSGAPTVEKLRPVVRDSVRWDRKGPVERAAQAVKLLALLKGWPEGAAQAGALAAQLIAAQADGHVCEAERAQMRGVAEQVRDAAEATLAGLAGPALRVVA